MNGYGMWHYRCTSCGHIELVSMKYTNPPKWIDYHCDECSIDRHLIHVPRKFKTIGEAK